MPVGHTDALQALAASVDGQLLEMTVGGGVRGGAVRPLPAHLLCLTLTLIHCIAGTQLTAGRMQGSEKPGPRAQHGQWVCS